MEDRRQFLMVLAALLTTAMDVGGTVPQGPCYMALMSQAGGCTLEQFQNAVRVLVEAELATATSETLTLTPKGREKAMLINRRLAEVEKGRP